ncbi:hypothetical protein MAGR_58600 [Mycolicibacterium agri]|uniref:Uncharacterized protein n=1 Tax=Mycolicibacterium agri TaxID=36811 RepID=A0A7I9WAG4_MYCAG|nr:hypothetical protein MAGR_58600 [Mycolicibacterium agri]
MMRVPGRTVGRGVVRLTNMKPRRAKPKSNTAINFAGEPLLFRGPAGTEKAGRIGISRQRNPSNHGVCSRDVAASDGRRSAFAVDGAANGVVVTCFP